MVVRATNLISEMVKTAEIWVQNPFYLDRTKFLAPILNPAIKTNVTKELGRGISSQGNFRYVLLIITKLC